MAIFPKAVAHVGVNPKVSAMQVETHAPSILNKDVQGVFNPAQSLTSSLKTSVGLTTAHALRSAESPQSPTASGSRV